MSEPPAAWTQGGTQEGLAFRAELNCGGSRSGTPRGPLKAAGRAEMLALAEARE